MVCGPSWLCPGDNGHPIEAVGTSGSGRGRHLAEPLTSAQPPGTPDATGCLRPGSRPQSPGAGGSGPRGLALLSSRHTPKPGGASTATAARGRRGRVVSPKPPRAEPRETTSPTGVTVKRKKERGGWKAGAGERTAGDEDGTGEDLGSTHCVGRSSRGPRPLGRRGGCAGRSPRSCSTAAWGP